MNKDINKTLMALVPILRMNGEKVTSIEAVNDWYKAGDREYMKEVAEITYDNGTVRYADIGCDSNLTAIYDVVAVIQQIKPRSKAIERIERGVYSMPSAQPEITPEAAIEYLQTIGWMQEHDRVLSEYAQPMRKRGRWILDRSGAYCCSECMEPCAGYVMMKPRDKFCKMCGAKMEGDADG